MMITLPKKVLKEAGFKRGDKLEVIMEDGEVKIQKKKLGQKSLSEFAGLLKLGRPISNDEIEKIIDSMYGEEYEENIS